MAVCPPGLKGPTQARWHQRSVLSKLRAWWLIEGPSLNSVHPADAFAAAALRGPDRPFPVSLSRRLWDAQADRVARAFAAGSSDLGIEAGDRIAAVLPNGPERLTALPATARPCRTVVPVSPAPGYHLELVRKRVADRKVPGVVRSVGGLARTAGGNAGRRELAQVVPLELTAS